MKKLTLTLTAAFAALALLADDPTNGYMKIENVTLTQINRTQDVVVNYKLENDGYPAYILLDILTNGVSIGMDKIKTVSGDISLPLTNLVSEGANKTIVWKARQDWRGNLATNAEACVMGFYTNNLQEIPGVYMVVDLSGGPNATSYPVSYSLSAPEPLTDTSCASNHLWLRRIEAGTFTMGSPGTEAGRTADHEAQHQVELTKAFFMGVFPVTQGQYKLIMGSVPSGQRTTGPAALCPVSYVSYNVIRGSNTVDNINWPNTGTQVSENSFLSILRNKMSGFVFDLPTEAQWEYACRAGTTTAWNNGTDFCTNSLGIDANLSKLGWYGNSLTSGNATTACPVGQKLCNAWGIYDCHGNIFEWCLDWYCDNPGNLSDGGKDPVGNTTGYNRVSRGGSWLHTAERARSAYRGSSYPPASLYQNFGFRLACPAVL